MGVSVGLLMACITVQRLPLTRTFLNKHRLARTKLDALQVYNLGEIHLRRKDLSTTSSVTTGGQIRFVDDRTVEEVRIPDSTEGLVVDYAADLRVIHVAFEKDTAPVAFDLVTPACRSEHQYSICETDLPTVHVGTYAGRSFVGRYCLSLVEADWRMAGPFGKKGNNGKFALQATVFYDNKVWEALEDSARVCIEIERTREENTSESSRTLKGYSVDER